MLSCKLCKQEFNINKELIKHLIKEHKFELKQVYAYFNIDFNNPHQFCIVCNTEYDLDNRQFNNFKNDNNKIIGCCKSCRSFLQMTMKNPWSSDEVKEKIKQTNLERYGVEHNSQSVEFKNKLKQSNLKKYGVEHTFQVTEFKEKAKQTNLKKYGVENPNQCKEVRDKIKKTNLEKYGGNAPVNSKEVQEKIKQTNLEKYGVETPLESKEIQEKIKQTNLERYGNEFAIASEFVRNKSANTNLERYGAENVWNKDSIIRDNIEKTNLEKYGVKTPLESKEIQEKIKQTNLEKYGVEYLFQSKEVQEKIKQTNLERYGNKYVIATDLVKNKSKQTNLERYGVEYFCQHEKCIEANGHRISKINRDFYDKLIKEGLNAELEYTINNNGFDLKVDNILIELDPWYTHNSTIGAIFTKGFTTEPQKPDYHYNKTKLAIDNNFRCIHIFDWDNQDKVINLLKLKENIYARKCDIKEVNSKIARKFLNDYHLQNSTRLFQYAYGLFYNNELVQIMTFGKPRYNKNYEYELLRLCTKPGFNVIGGASKLLTYFEKTVKPKSIISYCDLSKFSGEVYEKLGFKLHNISGPSKHWYNPKTCIHITDNLLRQRGFDQLHNMNFGKGTSNEELMLMHGYIEIYDCGQSTYIKILKNL